MYFINDQHEQNFMALKARVPLMNADREYRAVGYILALPELSQKGAAKYFSDDRFEAVAMTKKVDLSRGYRLMVELARNLFNSSSKSSFNLANALDVLDGDLYRVMLQATAIRRGLNV